MQLFGKRRRAPAPPGDAMPAAPVQASASVVRRTDGAATSLALAAAAADFAALGVAPWLQAACVAMGIRSPTPVQQHCIPPALAGRDVIGCAQTGSGKTLAFAVPILQALAADPYGIFAVVLTPARELAFQIAEQFAALGAPVGVRVAVVVGGLDIVTQAAELSRQPHVVVATPGRLAHHLSAGAEPRPALSSVAWLVLDEVDRLLDPSMAADLAVVLRAVHGGRGAGGSALRLQTLLFSATMRFRPGELSPLRLSGPPFVYGAALAGVGAARSGGEEAASGSGSGGAGAAAAAAAAAAGLPLLPAGLVHEYVFVPSAVKHAYLLVLLLAAMGPDLSVDSAIAAAARSRHGKKRQQPQHQQGRRAARVLPQAAAAAAAAAVVAAAGKRPAASASGARGRGGGSGGGVGGRRRVIGARSAVRTAAEERVGGTGVHAVAARAAAESVVVAAMDQLAAKASQRSGGGLHGAVEEGSGEDETGVEDEGEQEEEEDEGGSSGDDAGLSPASASAAGQRSQRAGRRHRRSPTGDTDSDEEEAEDEGEGADAGGSEEEEDPEEDEDEEGKEGAEEEAEAEQLPPARSAILFLSTCRSAALVSELLLELGIPNVALHSAMPQAGRLASLAKFRGSLVRVLVATDVASRGLDIPTVDLVVNADVPAVPSDYVHRVGRTARAGRPGRAVSLVTQYDVELVHAIESTVLGGAQLQRLRGGGVDDAAVLPRLGRVAAALELAKARLAESGIADALAVKKARRWQKHAAPEEQGKKG